MADIEYPSEAKQLTSVFTQYRNSINIYTEDNDKDKKFYVTLLKRLLQDTDVVINDIIPLGSCDEVIAGCSKDNDPNPKLYIVDGDIHLMTTPKEKIDNLFILDRYCIENFIIDEDAYYKMYDEIDYEHSIDEIKILANFDEIIDHAVVPFMELFQNFAVSQNIQGVFILKDANQFMNSNGEVDNSKIEAEKNFVVKDVCSHAGISESEYYSYLDGIVTLFPSSRENLLKYVSGKDYLIPYIVRSCKSKLSQSIGIKKEGWKYQFAKYCNIAPLSTLKEKIVNAVHSAVTDS